MANEAQSQQIPLAQNASEKSAVDIFYADLWTF